MPGDESVRVYTADPTAPTAEVDVDVVGTKVIQRVKLDAGGDGVSAPVTAAAPLPVVQTGASSLPTGAATEATLAAQSAKLPSALGQKTMANSLAVVVASDQTAVPISAASLPLPTGATTEATLGTASTRIGDVVETAPSNDTNTSGLNGRLQRIAQRLTSLIAVFNIGAGTEANAVRVTLPTDGTGKVNAAQSGTWTVQPGNTANTTAWKVDGSAVTQPVSGTVTANAGTGTRATAGDVASGSADSGNPVKIGGKVLGTAATPANLADGQRADLILTSEGAAIIAGISSISGDSNPAPASMPIRAANNASRALAVGPTLYNATAWDRQRGNFEATLLASAARTGTTNSPDQTNFNGQGVLVHLNVTANPGGAETLSLRIEIKDPVSGTYVSVADAGVLFTAANGSKALLFAPGTIAADLVTGVTGKSGRLPRTWRAVVTHSAAGSWTYSLAATTIL